jgi:hypothetical protein
LLHEIFEINIDLRFWPIIFVFLVQVSLILSGRRAFKVKWGGSPPLLPLAEWIASYSIRAVIVRVWVKYDPAFVRVDHML